MNEFSWIFLQFSWIFFNFSLIFLAFFSERHIFNKITTIKIFLIQTVIECQSLAPSLKQTFLTSLKFYILSQVLGDTHTFFIISFSSTILTMNEISRTAIVAAAGTAAVAFLGYCIYFDHKRRSDPEYKKKVRERKSKPKFDVCVYNKKNIIGAIV